MATAVLAPCTRSGFAIVIGWRYSGRMGVGVGGASADIAPTVPAAMMRADYRGALKSSVARMLCAVGVPALSRHLRRRELTILMLHGVEAEPLRPPCPYVHDVATLKRQLSYVGKHFHVLPLETALTALAAGTLPDQAAAITFDDGTANLLTYAAPVLHDLGLPAAVFVTTGPMDSEHTLWPDELWLAFTRTSKAEVDLTQWGLGVMPLGEPALRAAACTQAVEYLKTVSDSERITRAESLMFALSPGAGGAGPFRILSWPQADALTASGISLHPHSVTHPILSRCSDAKVEAEITDSCAAVERATGSAPTIFAYPNGRPQDFDDRAKSALRRHGIQWALATSSGLAGRRSDPLALPRVSIGSQIGFAEFRLVVSGALTWTGDGWLPGLRTLIGSAARRLRDRRGASSTDRA